MHPGCSSSAGFCRGQRPGEGGKGHVAADVWLLATSALHAAEPLFLLQVGLGMKTGEREIEEETWVDCGRPCCKSSEPKQPNKLVCPAVHF